MMDYLLLSLVKKIAKCTTTQLRILIASLLGAVLTCIVVVLPLPYASIKIVLFHTVINTIMIVVGFKVKDKGEFIRCYIFLYIGGFLLGGVFQYFQQYMKVSSLFFLFAVGSYWAVQGIWRVIQYFQLYQSRWYEVEVFIGNSSVRLKALLDTGNGLCDPYSGSPVHIIEMQAVKAVLSTPFMEGARYIPYHSLGHDGTMLMIKGDKMCLHGDRDCWLESPLLALSEEKLSVNHSYQMILNPDIL